MADADIVPSRYAGKVALVAGGGSGIGEAISRRPAAIGGSVTVLDLNHQNGRRVVGGARNDGRTASLQHGDVTDRGSLALRSPSRWRLWKRSSRASFAFGRFDHGPRPKLEAG